MKNKYIVIALVVVVLAGAGGFIWFNKNKDTSPEPTATNTTQDASAVVATWNNGATTITRGQLDTQIKELAQNPQIQVPDASQTEARTAFESLVLDQMIGGILLYDEAKRQGFTVDDAAVDKELATITGQYKDVAAFEAALLAAQIDKDTLRENITRNLVTNQYYEKIVSEHPVTVTEEEIQAFFDTTVKPQDAKAVFDEVKDRIKATLEQQKTQEVVAAVVKDLRTAANVEVRL